MVVEERSSWVRGGRKAEVRAPFLFERVKVTSAVEGREEFQGAIKTLKRSFFSINSDFESQPRIQP